MYICVPAALSLTAVWFPYPALFAEAIFKTANIRFTDHYVLNTQEISRSGEFNVFSIKL